MLIALLCVCVYVFYAFSHQEGWKWPHRPGEVRLWPHALHGVRPEGPGLPSPALTPAEALRLQGRPARQPPADLQSSQPLSQLRRLPPPDPHLPAAGRLPPPDPHLPAAGRLSLGVPASAQHRPTAAGLGRSQALQPTAHLLLRRLTQPVQGLQHKCKPSSSNMRLIHLNAVQFNSVQPSPN